MESRQDMVSAILTYKTTITLESLAYMTDQEVWTVYSTWVLGQE